MATVSGRHIAFGALGLAVLLAIAVFLYSDLTGRADQAASAQGSSACWGCDQISALRDGLPPDASTARAALDIELDRCRADPSCGRAPADMFAATCAGPWPDDAAFARLSRVLESLFAVASACRDAVCPDIDCRARARTVTTLAELRGAIAAVVEHHDVPTEDLSLLIDDAAALTLSLGDVVRGTRSRAAWRADAAAWISRETALADSADLAVAWRLRHIAAELEEIATLLAAHGEAPDWREPFVTAAGIMIETGRARDTLNARSQPACGGLDMSRADAIREQARDAEALLAVCAARAACDGSDEISGLEPFGTRRSGGPDDLRAFADQATDLLEQMGGLDLVPQAAPRLGLERRIFAASEAIQVQLDISATACMAEPGALLAIVDAANPGAPRFSASLVARPQQDVLLEAPQELGPYEVVARAPLARGGGTLAATSIEVNAARPDNCEGFTGVWLTDFGELVMYQHGNAVRGTYRRFEDVRPGFLVGEAEDGTLRGDWESELGAGSVRLQLAADGMRFSGSWTHALGVSSGSGRWSGACITAE